MAKVTKKEMEKVASEFNKLMELEPAIEVGKKTNMTTLTNDIKEAAAELRETDHLTKSTLNILSRMGIEHKAFKKVDEKKKTKAPTEKNETEAPAEKKEKNDAPKAPAASRARAAERKDFIGDMIAKSTFAAKEILEAAMEAFPEVKKSTIQTFITDSKNEKYKKYEKLVIVVDGKVQFEK